MPKNPLKLKVGYLYPDILQGYCDDANVETFAKRAKWRDIDVQIHPILTNDRITSSKYDFYYIGGSNPEALTIVQPFIKENEDELRIAAFSSVPMLAINAGYQVFGNSYQLKNTVVQEGLGILNVTSVLGNKFLRGNVIGSCNFLNNKIIAGFESHKMISFLKENTAPFLNLKRGFGNNSKKKSDGAKFNNVIGTYLSGPILAQNPHLCDFFIATALKIKYKCKIPLTKLKDDVEWYSHRYILETK